MATCIVNLKNAKSIMRRGTKAKLTWSSLKYPYAPRKSYTYSGEFGRNV